MFGADPVRAAMPHRWLHGFKARRFARMTLIECSAFVEWIKTRNLGWWHWIPGFWLIIAKTGDVNTEDIRNQLRKITDRKDIMVLEIEKPKTWSGYGPDTRERDMFKWIRGAWAED